MYSIDNEENLEEAADAVPISELPEEKRIALLRRAIVLLTGYNPSKSVFCKQRHWESIYRIAADQGFVIDKDYVQFKRYIDSMNLEGLPTLSVDLLERLNTGIYAESYVDWRPDGLTGKKLNEYVDIKRVADEFNNKVEQVTKKQ